MTQSETPHVVAVDAAQIFASVGDVPYEWQITTDTLRWGANVRSILGLPDTADIDTGRAFAQLLDPNTPLSRFDAVMRSSDGDQGSGVFYQLKYCLRPMRTSGTGVWVEDTGRWFAGPDGRPSHAHGVVRVINDRHAQEQQLAYLSQFDGLTGEMNRWRLAEVLSATLEEATNSATPAGSCWRRSTIFRVSTKPTAMTLPMKSSRPSPSACAPRCAAPTYSAVSPATSSASF
jgi:hypothetical protein